MPEYYCNIIYCSKINIVSHYARICDGAVTSQVNNIPQVQTQSDFRALIKAQNIPHLSYDIDGDGIVSQEDYALAKVSASTAVVIFSCRVRVSILKIGRGGGRDGAGACQNMFLTKRLH